MEVRVRRAYELWGYIRVCVLNRKVEQAVVRAKGVRKGMPNGVPYCLAERLMRGAFCSLNRYFPLTWASCASGMCGMRVPS